MWEDNANKHGGRWLLNLEKKQRNFELDKWWLDIVSFYITLVPRIRDLPLRSRSLGDTEKVQVPKVNYSFEVCHLHVLTKKMHCFTITIIFKDEIICKSATYFFTK